MNRAKRNSGGQVRAKKGDRIFMNRAVNSWIEYNSEGSVSSGSFQKNRARDPRAAETLI